MQKILIDGHSAVFLDHCKLINESFASHSDQTIETYELNKDLFAFHAREAKRTQAGKKDADLTEELQKWKDLSEKCIGYLQKHKYFPQQLADSELPRCWEESHEFPQLHGANKTNSFKKFTYKAAPTAYIIPPQCIFFNHNIMQLNQLMPQLTCYDLIILDPPWRNKYIRRVKRARVDSGYSMLHNEQLQKLPIEKLLHKQSLVAIWCTNSPALHKALVNDILPQWKLRLVHMLPWFKLNTSGALISSMRGIGSKQPFEMLFIATHADNQDFENLKTDISKIEMLLSVPSLVHSHKPPLLAWLQQYLPISKQDNLTCLELFARYLQPQFTSIGLEVLKLMDVILYKSTL